MDVTVFAGTLQKLEPVNLIHLSLRAHSTPYYKKVRISNGNRFKEKVVIVSANCTRFAEKLP